MIESVIFHGDDGSSTKVEVGEDIEVQSVDGGIEVNIDGDTIRMTNYELKELLQSIHETSNDT